MGCHLCFQRSCIPRSSLTLLDINVPLLHLTHTYSAIEECCTRHRGYAVSAQALSQHAEAEESPAVCCPATPMPVRPESMDSSCLAALLPNLPQPSLTWDKLQTQVTTWLPLLTSHTRPHLLPPAYPSSAYRAGRRVIPTSLPSTPQTTRWVRCLWSMCKLYGHCCMALVLVLYIKQLRAAAGCSWLADAIMC